MGHRRNLATVFGSGVILGLGVASTHYLGMMGMHIGGAVRYDTRLVGISVGVAVVVTTIAMWCATKAKHLGASLAAALIMGLAFTGMHYTGMAGDDGAPLQRRRQRRSSLSRWARSRPY